MNDNAPKLGREEAIQQISSLIPEVISASQNNDLESLINIIETLGLVADAAGVDMTSISGNLARLKSQASKAKAHFENFDAALWAGDFKRAEMLQASPPRIDVIDPVIDADTYLAPDPAMMSDVDETGAPLDLGDAWLDEPDAYADIAAGKPGAIADVIRAGHDLNRPSGYSGHTALLAALDAPGRRVDDIRALIDAGADPLLLHETGDNAIIWATGYRHLSTVTPESERALFRYLASLGIDPEQQNPDIGCPFLRALLEGNLAQVDALLDLKVDTSPCLPLSSPLGFLAGATPIMLAAPKPDVVARLIEIGVDVAAQDLVGRDPLQFLAEMAESAQGRADPADPWTVTFAANLTKSQSLLSAAIRSKGSS